MKVVGFDESFDRVVVKIEKGYVKNPADPGGETNCGITWPVLNEAIALNIVPPGTTIASLTFDTVKPIYKTLFWDRGQMEQFDPAISYQAFDAAVNCGISQAMRFIQKAASVADDGHIGPVTVAAVKAQPVTRILALMTAAQLEFKTYLSNWGAAGKGWARRCVQDIRYAVIDYEQEQATPVIQEIA